jgi:hypothetical protein
MKPFASIDRDLALSVFDYEPESGRLVWKARNVDDPRWNGRNLRVAGKEAGHRHTCTVGKTYLQVRVDNKMHYAHRIAWVMMHGAIPPGMQVDHIDGDGANNRASNLRLVTGSENKRNQRRLSNNTSGYTGVYLDKRRGRYSARVWDNGRFLTLGHTATAEEAYEIRQRYNRANGFHENHGQERPL